jgi:hypothetical protein
MTRNILKSGMVLAALVGAFTVAGVKQADAAFVAYICNDAACSGGGDVIVTDQSAGDGSGVAGIILASGSVGGLNASFNIATSKPSLPQPQMDITYNANGAGEVWFYAVDTDFSVVYPFVGSNDGNSSTGALVESQICGGNTNTPGANGLLGNCGALASTSTSPFHQLTSHVAATANPYALMLMVHVKQTGGITTGDFLVVPEPATMSLFGLGLAGLAAFRRRSAR